MIRAEDKRRYSVVLAPNSGCGPVWLSDDEFMIFTGKAPGCRRSWRSRRPGWQQPCTSRGMLSYFKSRIGWGGLLKRTVVQTNADNGLNLAANLAYYFFLALFPALIFLLALTSYFPSVDFSGRIVNMLSGAAPGDVVNIISTQVTQITQGQHGGLLTFGVVTSIWSASSGLAAVMDALNHAYHVTDERSWLRQHAIALLLTIGLVVFIVVSITLVVGGPQLAGLVADKVGLGAVFEWAWTIVQWPVVFGLMAMAFALVYYFAPDVEQDFAWLTPGSVFATILWLAGSLGLRFYVTNFGSYNATYGAIGAVMVLLLWLYVSGVVLIAGAEMNAIIEHSSPYGKAEGEKVATGEKTPPGARAARDFRLRHNGRAPAR